MLPGLTGEAPTQVALSDTGAVLGWELMIVLSLPRLVHDTPGQIDRHLGVDLLHWSGDHSATPQVDLKVYRSEGLAT